MDAAQPLAPECAPARPAAEDAKAALNAEIGAAGQVRSPLQKSEGFRRSKAKSEKAAADGAAGKEQAKSDATTAISDATTAVTDAKAMLEKAPKGKGTQADLEAMKADLTAADSTIADANSAMAAEKYKDAKAKAEAAKSSAANVVSQIQAAMEAKKVAKPAGKHK
jgi:hypothetical protein